MKRIEHQPEVPRSPDGRLGPRRPLLTGSDLGLSEPVGQPRIMMGCSKCAKTGIDLDPTHSLCVTCWDAQITQEINHKRKGIVLQIATVRLDIGARRRKGTWKLCAWCSQPFYARLYQIKKGEGKFHSKRCGAKYNGQQRTIASKQSISS